MQPTPPGAPANQSNRRSTEYSSSRQSRLGELGRWRDEYEAIGTDCSSDRAVPTVLSSTSGLVYRRLSLEASNPPASQTMGACYYDCAV
jgi:hypothetical protein